MESEILLARINDTFDIAQRTNKPKFFGFLTVEEASLTQKTLEKRNADFQLFGGYQSAERVLLCCKPEWCDDIDFPISAVTFSYRKTDKLRHRDVLGTLMALGITRESVGDILVEDGRAVVFLKDEVLNFVITNIAKIGGVGVSAKIGFDLPLPEADALIDLSVTVSSLRLDCVVAALCGVSRNKANEIIAMGFVSVNSLVFEKSTKQITDGDVLSVRGKGKFIVKSTLNKTKKDRTVLEFKKYL